MTMRQATWVVALVALAAALFGLSRLVLDDGDDGIAAGDVRPLPRAPVSAPPPTAASDARPDAGRRAEAEEAGVAQLPFRPPSTYALGTPERALASFLAAWRDQHWTRMATWSALEWRRQTDRPADWLAQRFGGRRPHGFLIQSRIRRPGTARYRVLVEYRALPPQLRREVLALPVVRPGDEQLRTAPGLRWGVDPAAVEAVARVAAG